MSTASLKKYSAEMLATFTLTLGVSLSILFELPVATPVIAGLIVAMFVYTIGPVSGAHINPCVTFGMLCIKKITPKDSLFYVASQVVGASLAMLTVNTLTGSVPVAGGADSFVIVLAEAAGAFLLVFAVASVATGKVGAGASGAVVGGSLLMGILIASVVSNGVLNPAVALGIGSLSLSYIAGPLLGGGLGALAFRWMTK